MRGDEVFRCDVAGFLDFAIDLALTHLELTLIERLIRDKSEPFTEEQLRIITIRHDWRIIEQEEIVTRVILLISRLETLQEETDLCVDIFSTPFAVKYRYGFKVIPYLTLYQRLLFLQGVFLHSNGKPSEALYQYTQSLTAGGPTSCNTVRLSCLENIKIITDEKRTVEQYFKERVRAGGQQKTTALRNQ